MFQSSRYKQRFNERKLSALKIFYLKKRSFNDINTLSFFTISDKRVNNLIVKLKKNILLLFALYENLVYLQRIKRSYNKHSIAL